MGKAYLFTGEPRVGKTTALKRVLDTIGIERCGGFYTEEVCVMDERCGFRLVTLDGRVGTVADVIFESELRVGKYGVSLPVLEDIGLTAISQAVASKSFVIIDEIGPMQLYSERFKQAVMDVLCGTHPLLGTICSRSHPWSDDLKKRGGVQLFPLTYENRHEMPRIFIDAMTL